MCSTAPPSANCIYLYQDTTLQANHNLQKRVIDKLQTVFIYIKIQLCKQTTTLARVGIYINLLYLSISRYNFASKPQRDSDPQYLLRTVFIYIKIQLCKQTTTFTQVRAQASNCIYLYQDTTLQANHNLSDSCFRADETVFIYIKIQLCKQTTTP